MAEQAPIAIAFDEENNIRVLEAEKYRESDQLKGLSMEFITKVIVKGNVGYIYGWKYECPYLMFGWVCCQNIKGEIKGFRREKQMGKWGWKPEKKDDGFK